MTADRDTRLVYVAERLTVAGSDHVEDVDVVLIGVSCQFVGEADIDVSVRRFSEFGEFRRLAVAKVPDPVRLDQVVAFVELKDRVVEA